MASVMKLAIGLAIPYLECLEGIRIGVALYVSYKARGTKEGTDMYPGLATNFLLIESLQRFYQYYGDNLQVECPTGSGEYMNLAGVAEEIQHRIIHIFGRDVEGKRATNGGNPKLDYDPYFRDYVWFYEVGSVLCCILHAHSITQFFHGDTGHGLGASHQTGW